MRLNSYNLVMSAMFGGRRGPRPPAGNPTSIACHGLMDKVGVSFPEAHLNPNAMAELALAGHELVGFDTVMPEYSVDQESAALGAQVDWGDRDRMPDVKAFPYADFSDVRVPADLLEKPSCRVVLDALSILRRHVGGRVAIVGKVMGPWTLSYHMAGTQNFLLAVGMGETDKVRKMLRQLAPVTIAFANAQFAAGADIVVLADHATRNLVGPHHYEEYLLPIHQEITAQVGGPLILHVCGNCSDRLELFATHRGRRLSLRVGDRFQGSGQAGGRPHQPGREHQQRPDPPAGDTGRRLPAGPLRHRGRGEHHRPGVRHPAFNAA